MLSEMRATAGCEVRRRREGEQASRPSPASGAATAALLPRARSPAAQAVAPGSGREAATPQGGAGLQAGLQGLVAYSDSDSDQGDLAQIDV